MVHRRHPHHTHFGTSLSPSCKQMPLSQLMHGWMDSWMDGWISFTPFTFLLHSQCTSVFLLPAVLRCQKSLSPCLESEGGISVSIQSCVGGRRQTMNIRICGIELRVIFSAILLPHLPAPRAAELETNLREVWWFINAVKAPTRAFSLSKAPTSAFSFKNLLDAMLNGCQPLDFNGKILTGKQL